MQQDAEAAADMRIYGNAFFQGVQIPEIFKICTVFLIYIPCTPSVAAYAASRFVKAVAAALDSHKAW